jgi:hypothetical protein
LWCDSLHPPTGTVMAAIVCLHSAMAHLFVMTIMIHTVVADVISTDVADMAHIVYGTRTL